MRLDVVRIGNSRGIRLPKAIIEQCGFGDAVDVTVRKGTLHVTAARRSRHGWGERFKAMAESGHDEPIDGGASPTTFDRTEWTW
jgi:antitoxin MazE